MRSILFILIIITELSISSATIHPIEQIRFVITNYNECSFALNPAIASLKDLHHTITRSCDIRFPFEISFCKQTIVSPKTQRWQQNKRILKHPGISSMMKTLRELPMDEFQIPLRIKPLRPLAEDIATYNLLTGMFIGNDTNIHEFQWYGLIKHCAQSQSCDIEYLCRHFGGNFRCDEGKLKEIDFSGPEINLKGHLDLSRLPPSVEKLKVRGNSVTQVLGLDQLNGKRLLYLGIRDNPCKIDLRALERSPTISNGVLRSLSVDFDQIKSSLVSGTGHMSMKAFNRKAKDWVNRSILDTLWVGDCAWWIERKIV